MPQTTVAVAIIDEVNDTILLTTRACPPYENMECLPGGHIDIYETAEDAIVREIKEEIGLDIINGEFAGYRDEIVPEKQIHNIVLFYIVSINSTKCTLNINPSEVLSYRWIDIDEAINLKLAFDHQELIKMI